MPVRAIGRTNAGMFASRASRRGVHRTGTARRSRSGPRRLAVAASAAGSIAAERAAAVAASPRRARARPLTRPPPGRSARRATARPGSRRRWSASPSRSRTPDRSRRPRASRARAGRRSQLHRAVAGDAEELHRGLLRVGSGASVATARSAARTGRTAAPEPASAPDSVSATPRSQCRASSGSNGTRPEAARRERRGGGRLREERLDGVAVAAVVAAHVLDVAEQAIGALRQSADRARDDASGHLRRNRHEQERGLAVRETRRTGRCARRPAADRTAAGRARPTRTPRAARRGARTPGSRARCATLPRPRSRTRASADSGTERPPRRRDAVAAARHRSPSSAGDERHSLTPAMRAWVGPLKSASRMATRRPAAAQRGGEMQRQRALADPALAGADGDEMAHAGEPSVDRARRCSATCSTTPEPPSPTMWE